MPSSEATSLTSLGGCLAMKEPAGPSGSTGVEESSPIIGTTWVSLFLLPIIETPKWGASVGILATCRRGNGQHPTVHNTHSIDDVKRSRDKKKREKIRKEKGSTNSANRAYKATKPHSPKQ